MAEFRLELEEMRIEKPELQNDAATSVGPADLLANSAESDTKAYITTNRVIASHLQKNNMLVSKVQDEKTTVDDLNETLEQERSEHHEEIVALQEELQIIRGERNALRNWPQEHLIGLDLIMKYPGGSQEIEQIVEAAQTQMKESQRQVNVLRAKLDVAKAALTTAEQIAVGLISEKAALQRLIQLLGDPHTYQQIVNYQANTQQKDLEIVNYQANIQQKDLEISRLRRLATDFRELVECCVCLEHQVITMLFPCDHTMCQSCLTKMAETVTRRGQQMICPQCRSKFAVRDVEHPPLYHANLLRDIGSALKRAKEDHGQGGE